jgi:hypothetical protein
MKLRQAVKAKAPCSQIQGFADMILIKVDSWNSYRVIVGTANRIVPLEGV